MIIIQICDIFQKKEKSQLILQISVTMLIMNVKSWCRFFNEAFRYQGNLKLAGYLSVVAESESCAKEILR